MAEEEVVFEKSHNPITGEDDWESKSANYDEHQEIARSAFADMLHDTERNQKYYAAITKIIARLHHEGRVANVLDIGTGSGILSMMAVKCGADSVTACEAFLPMAHCAEKIIKANGMSDNIRLIKKPSSEVDLGDGKDNLLQKANILVTELFDTELIGEGAIEIFNDAHRRLLTEDCFVIPESSNVYIQVVECPLISAWYTPKLLTDLDGEILIKIPPAIEKCCGDAAVQDMQLSQLPTSQFTSIGKPTKVFQFHWNGKQIEIPKNRINTIRFHAASDGVPQAVFFWWDIKMDAEGENILSCAPFWARPDIESLCAAGTLEKSLKNRIPWRDHWMQGIYQLTNSLHISKDQEFYINAHHDDFSFWFNFSKTRENAISIPRLQCTCSLHLIYSRTRIGQLNQSQRNKKYLRLLEEIIHKDAKVLVLSDGSFQGLAIAAMKAKSVILLEPHRYSNDTINSVVKMNKLKNVMILNSIDELTNAENLTHIFGEPHFISSILPWDNFHFGTLLNKIRDKLNPNVQILPSSATVYALAVEFLDLHKIKAPVIECEGFDMLIFDQYIKRSSVLSDSNVEAQPLWEYPCKALSHPMVVLPVDFNEFTCSQTLSGAIKITSPGSCNGIALWVDWHLDGIRKNPRNTVSSGPAEPIVPNKFITWDMYSRQGVHLVEDIQTLDVGDFIDFTVKFLPLEGQMNFEFKLVKKRND